MGSKYTKDIDYSYNQEQVKCDNNCNACPIFVENMPTDKDKRSEIFNKLGLCTTARLSESMTTMFMRSMGMIR